MKMRVLLPMMALLFFLLPLAACGSGDGSSTAAASTPTASTGEVTATPTVNQVTPTASQPIATVPTPTPNQTTPGPTATIDQATPTATIDQATPTPTIDQGQPTQPPLPTITLSPSSLSQSTCTAISSGWNCSVTVSQPSQQTLGWSVASSDLPADAVSYAPSSGTLSADNQYQQTVIISIASSVCQNSSGGTFAFSSGGRVIANVTWSCQ